MTNPQALLQTITQHKSQLRAFGLVRVGIFGSVIRGEERKNSDIDVMLDFDPAHETYRNFLQSTSLLETLFNRPVDAVTPQGLSPYIRPYIEKEIHYVQIN